jgi:hypothetical protein
MKTPRRVWVVEKQENIERKEKPSEEKPSEEKPDEGNEPGKGRRRKLNNVILYEV